MNVVTYKQQRMLKICIPALRKAGGWTLEEFGNMLGVTKQAISALEREKDKIPSKTFYIAAKYVLKEEAERATDKEMLSQIYKMAFVESSCLTEENTLKIEQAVALTTGALGRLAAASITGALVGLLGSALYDFLDLRTDKL